MLDKLLGSILEAPTQDTGNFFIELTAELGIGAQNHMEFPLIHHQSLERGIRLYGCGGYRHLEEGHLPYQFILPH